MKRLALALTAAATILGTGCTVSPAAPVVTVNGGTIDIAWSFRRYDAAGNLAATYHCATPVYGTTTPLVHDVVVSIDGVATVVPCNDGTGDGGAFVDVAPGTHTLVVSGREWINGAAVETFTAQAPPVSVASGATTPVTLPLDGIPGSLDVWGGLFSSSGATAYSCYPSVPTGTVTISDSAGTTVATGTATCAYAPTGNYELGVGFSGASALDLDVYAIRMTASAGGYDTSVYPSCNVWPSFDHLGNDTGVAGWYPKLYAVAGSACP